MSLSTQLTRGTLALPMLALFAALALAAGPAPEAVTKSADTLLILRVGDTGNCGALARPQLLLARAPADLGPLAQRHGAGCRA
jgi:hypothetical protein